MNAEYALKGRLATIGVKFVLPAGIVIVAGAMCAFLPSILPWWAPFVLLAGLGVLVATAIYPLVGLVVTIFLTFQVVPPQFAPDIPFGPIKLGPAELIFLWTIFVYAARVLLSVSIDKIERPRFTVPVVFILVCVAVGVIYGKYFQHNGSHVLSEARGFLGLLAVPLVQLVVRDRRGIEQLCFWICIAGVVVSMYVIVQTITGIPIMGGRFEVLDRSNPDVMRTISAGVTMQAFALYYMTVSLWTGSRFRYWLIPLVLVVLLGLLGTFGRTVWVTTACGGLIVAFLVGRWRGLFIATLLGSILVGMAISAAFVVKPRVAEAAVERALGIGRAFSHGGSWGWRERENVEALKVIQQHPLLGIGIGGAYKNVAVAVDKSFPLEAYYVHNSYLYFPLKMGLIAGLGPLFIAGAFGLLFLRIYRETSGRVGPIVAVSAALAATCFVGAYAAPLLKSFAGWLTVAITLGLCATTYKLMHQKPARSSITPTKRRKVVQPLEVSQRAP